MLITCLYLNCCGDLIQIVIYLMCTYSVHESLFYHFYQDDNDIFNVSGHGEDWGNANNVEEAVNIEQVLDAFRRQWQDELSNAKAVPSSDSEDKHLEQTHQDSQPSIEEQVISVESTCLIEKYIDLFLIIREDNIFTGQGPVS